MSNRLVVVGSDVEYLVRFRWDLIVAAKNAGWQVYAMAPERDEEVAEKFRQIDVTYVSYFLRRTGMNPFLDMFSLLSLCVHFLRIRPDVAFFYTVKPVIYGLLAAALTGVKRRYALLAGLGYAFDDGESGLVGKVVRRLYKFALRFTTKTIFQNPDDEQFFKTHGLLSPQAYSFVVNGSGIELSRFPVAPLPDGNISFLMMARLLATKGVRQYAAAAKIIKTKYPQVSIKLAGWIDGGPDSITQQELDAWVKEGCLDYLGRLSEVRPAIADSSVYVLPSYYREGIPRSVLEAMSMGRAIITTDAPGCRETVVTGDNGFLIPVRSVDALVMAMEQFIADPQLAPVMGQRSRQVAEDKYDVRKVNQVMMKEMGLI